MTTVGKILTVLIMIMSIVFMTLAVMTHATHRNWREEAVDKLKPRLVSQIQINSALQSQLQNLKNQIAAEQAARTSALATLQGKQATVALQLANQEAELIKKNAALTEMTQAAKLAEQTLKDLTDEVGKLRKEIRLAQEDRDTHFANAQTRLDKNYTLEAQKQRAEERLAQLTGQLARLKEVATKMGFSETTPTDHIPPDVAGVVLKVNDKGTLVEISIGGDEGLKKDHTLDVYRGGSYVGRIKIREVKPDRAVGEIIKEFQKAPVKTKDSVTTKLG